MSTDNEYSKAWISICSLVYSHVVMLCDYRYPEDRVPRIQALSQDKEQGVHPRAAT
jgi:hypothetical protein